MNHASREVENSNSRNEQAARQREKRCGLAPHLGVLLCDLLVSGVRTTSEEDVVDVLRSCQLGLKIVFGPNLGYV